MSDLIELKRVLISVANKDGLDGLAQGLAARGVEFWASGNTYKFLSERGYKARKVEDVTQFPEILGGRVKTLHPKIHGAILADSHLAEHRQDTDKHGIELLDAVIVDLYPFADALKKQVGEAATIEEIDIGGVALLRGAAKNFGRVVVLHSPKQYQGFLDELAQNEGKTTLSFRRTCAGQAFSHCSHYDALIADWMTGSTGQPQDLPTALQLNFRKEFDLRYGENPHQRAAFYLPEQGSSFTKNLLQGKALSYNNLLDLHFLLQLTWDLKDRSACIIMKHNNPCGIGIDASAERAFEIAKACDPVSAFGGIVAFTQVLNEQAANLLSEMFLEIVVAPQIDSKAKEVLSKKKNLRVFEVPDLLTLRPARQTIRSALEGYLVQHLTDDSDIGKIEKAKVVSTKAPSSEEWNALDLAWRVCKNVKSNAIVISNSTQTLGIGAGQMSRIDSLKIAASRLGAISPSVRVLASDAFFPFRDSVDFAAEYGISAIIQPGGSVKDNEVIAAANEHGISLVFTGKRYFSH